MIQPFLRWGKAVSLLELFKRRIVEGPHALVRGCAGYADHRRRHHHGDRHYSYFELQSDCSHCSPLFLDLELTRSFSCRKPGWKTLNYSVLEQAQRVNHTAVASCRAASCPQAAEISWPRGRRINAGNP